MPQQPDDLPLMRQAFAAARLARASGNMPFGAVLVRDGTVQWTSQNNQLTTHDCTGHAEVVLIREAAQSLGPQALQGATVYASGEPCAMCAGAMFWAGITRIVYGAPTPGMTATLGGPSPGMRCADVLAAARPAVEVVGPVLLDEAMAALA